MEMGNVSKRQQPNQRVKEGNKSKGQINLAGPGTFTVSEYRENAKKT